MKIIKGEALKTLDELRIKGNDFILVSDPPYNIGYHYNEYKDNLKEDEYFNLLKDIFSRSPHVLIHYAESLHKHSISIAEAPLKEVSWVYNSNTAKQHRSIAFYGVKPDFRKVGQPYKNPNDKRIKERIAQGKKARLYDWWNINQVKNTSAEKLDHPCQIPLEVMINIIGILPENKVIVDPFMGTGTTGLAAKKLGRDFIGVEMNDDYFNIAKKRLD